MVREIDPQQALQRQRGGALVVDVREPYEWARGHVSGAEHIPLDDLPIRLRNGALPREGEILFICASGGRSSNAAALATANGYRNVASVAGGTSRWAQLGLPIERVGQ
ncbi:MAG: rhodanese-like domain-containing protein [Candidatus Dormibacteraceae bacterium]